MSDLADYSETEIRDWISQGVDPDTAPGTLYVALHAGTPGDDGSTNEVSAGDYSREGVTTGTGWDTPTTSSFENAATVSLTATANNWGSITHATLWDASTNGNCLAILPLDASVTVDGSSTDETIEFAAGDLSFSID